ncbi:MAG: c-type cytochrome [Polyangiaceae bacterium]
MRYRQIIEGILVVLACMASGTLECGGPKVTDAQLRGAALYARTCAVCHGPGGEGYASDQAPALGNQRFLASATDDFLRSAIESGRRGTTMSAWSRRFGGPLARTDTDAIITFLRSLDDGPRAALDERPVSGDSGRGAGLYAHECAKCHGSRGTGGLNLNIGGADLLSTASNGFLRYAISGGRPGTAMPSFRKALGDAGIEDILALLRSWQATAARAPRFMPPPQPPPIPLGPVPLNPRGPEPVGFNAAPATTPVNSVKGQLDRGARLALLDARAPSDYLNEHIAGAVSVPFYDPSPYLGLLPRNAWLVCYCSCPHAESGQLAQKLHAAGFSKVTVLDEGFGVWKMRKYPTHTGIDP